MEILTNDICNFEILSKAHLLFEDNNTPKNPNLLSGVFFKRGEYYKNFGVYVSGLARTVKFVDDYNDEVEQSKKLSQNEKKYNLEHFVFLLFIDQNIRDDSQIMNVINSSRWTVPVLFHCPVYTEGKYHIDLFGTLVRFFPMFNFLNNPSQTSMVITIDIELNREDRRKVEALMKNRPKGVTASGEIHNLIYKGEVPYIYSGTLCFNHEKLESNLITKFINSAHTIIGTGHYGKRKTTFGYGIDEMFLNSHLIPAVKNYSIIIEYQISYFLYHSQPYIMKQKREEITNKILKMILYNLYNPGLSSEDMLNIIKESQFLPDLKKMIRRQARISGEITEPSENELEGVEVETSTENTGKTTESDTVLDSEIVDVSVEYEDSTTFEDKDSVMHKILSQLLGDLYDRDKTVEELLMIVDQKTYNIKEKNEVNNALAERFYFVIHDLVTHNKIWMEADVMRLIDKYLRNVISAYVVFEVNPDNKQIENITTFDVVYTDNTI